MRIPALAALALVSACSTIPDPPAPVLAGEWTVESIAGVPAPAGPVSIRFDGQRVSGQSGCNRFTGAVSHGPTTLTFGPVAGTRMACPDPARAETERAFLALLPELTVWRIEGGRLTLATADGRVLTARSAS